MCIGVFLCWMGLFVASFATKVRSLLSTRSIWITIVVVRYGICSCSKGSYMELAAVRITCCYVLSYS